MSKFLLSPSEVKLAEKLKGNAMVSSLPEEKGADILIYTKQGLLGIQRKEVPNDFLSSVSDGRLARGTSLLSKSCKFSLLLLEGHFRYFPDGRVAIGRKEPSRFTKKQINGILFDIKYIKGVDYDYTDDLDDTVFYIKDIAERMDKSKHLSLFTRPSGQKGTWIIPTTKETQSWVLQGFEGIGPALADAIMEYFGGIPLAWTCQLSELAKVPRLSAKRAKIMWETLGQPAVQLVEAPSDFNALRRKLKGG